MKDPPDLFHGHYYYYPQQFADGDDPDGILISVYDGTPLNNIHQRHPHRRLDDFSQGQFANSTVPYNDAEVLRDTFLIYGSIWICTFVLFCWMRQRFVKIYNLRNWVDELRSPMAGDQYGTFGWTAQMFRLTEDDLMQHCGMDALCFCRILSMGTQLCYVAMFNAIWLMPLYATAPATTAETQNITDNIVELTISNIDAGSPRLIGTALAAYALFGYCMRLVLLELEWFTRTRHVFLQQALPRNYAVHVRHIPDNYRTNATLATFFQSCFTGNALHAAQLRLHVPQLGALVVERTTCLARLEHAVADQANTGKSPVHRVGSNVAERVVPGAGRAVDAIDYFAAEIKRLNVEVATRMDAIYANIASINMSHDIEQQASMVQQTAPVLNTVNTLQSNPYSLPASSSDVPMEPQSGAFDHQYSHGASTDVDDKHNDEAAVGRLTGRIHNSGKQLLKTSVSAVKNASSKATETVQNATSTALSMATDSVQVAATTALTLIGGSDEGSFYSAGFCTFSSLYTTHAARQLLHHGTPFCLEVLEAPSPEDVFWRNVGRSHQDLMIGQLISQSATAGLCLFWTVPVTFVSSLTSVDDLRTQVEFVDSILDVAPWLEPVFAQLAPLLLIVLNTLLPTVLGYFSMFEGPVSGAVVEASLFSKLTAFMIIQTFFVTAISGGIMSELKGLVEQPTKVVSLLATSLPAQSTFFIQLLFIGTVIGCMLELFRVFPLLFAFLRKFIGPRLTKKERAKAFFFLRPLEDPNGFEHAAVTSHIVLYFMVLLVYAVIAPLTSFILFFCFVFNGVVYRHQFVYIIPPAGDSGGQLWQNYIKILCTCMLIAEFTIVGLLALKQSAIATPLMAPLIVVTILFSAYIRQAHFRAAEHLPSRDCLRADAERSGPAGEPWNLDFLNDAYLQPELQTRFVYPDIPHDRAEALGLLPPGGNEAMDSDGNLNESTINDGNPFVQSSSSNASPPTSPQLLPAGTMQAAAPNAPSADTSAEFSEKGDDTGPQQHSAQPSYGTIQSFLNEVAFDTAATKNKQA